MMGFIPPPNLPARWAMNPGGGGRRIYIEGTLLGSLDVGSIATLSVDFPVGGADEIEVAGHWFSANGGERIGAVWYKDLGMYVAIAKRCPSTAPTDPEPYSGNTSTDEDPFDPYADPGPPEDCPINWCKYEWNPTGGIGEVGQWELADSVGCGACDVILAAPPPEEGELWIKYVCCVI